MTKRLLKARDVERLENTSIASSLLGHTAMVGGHTHDALAAHGNNMACDLITCDAYCSTICNTIQTTVGGTGTGGVQPPCLPVTQPPRPPSVQSLVCPTRDCGPSFGGGPQPCQ